MTKVTDWEKARRRHTSGIAHRRHEAAWLDETDALREFRDAFIIAEADTIYLDGNSLGRLPKRTIARLQEIISREWGEQLIRSWNSGWFEAPARIGGKIAKLIGAEPGEVIVGDSTSVNLFKLAMAALMALPQRKVIVSDELNFPSDLYILQGCIELLGGEHTLHILKASDGLQVELDDLQNAVEEKTALVTLSHVIFKSGAMYDMPAITELAHRAGAMVLWDLSHSVGVVPIDLDAWGVDLAIGCTYKYLNGGPGAPAFLYVRKELQERFRSPIWGWFGQQNPFAFDLDYQPTNGIQRFLIGTPPVLSLLALDEALEITLQAGIPAIRKKSVRLTSFLIELFDEHLAPLGFELGTPRQPERRGSHISIRHPEGYRINQALIEEMKVIPDFREPDNIRLGLAPLYTSFSEVQEAIQRIRVVVEKRIYTHYSNQRHAVT